MGLKNKLSAQYVLTVVLKTNERNTFEGGLEKLKEDKFQSEVQPLQFGFSWRLRKLLSYTVGENK